VAAQVRGGAVGSLGRLEGAGEDPCLAGAGDEQPCLAGGEEPVEPERDSGARWRVGAVPLGGRPARRCREPDHPGRGVGPRAGLVEAHVPVRPEPENGQVDAAGRHTIVGRRGVGRIEPVDVDRVERAGRRRQAIEQLAPQPGVAAGRAAGREADVLVEQDDLGPGERHRALQGHGHEAGVGRGRRVARGQHEAEPGTRRQPTRQLGGDAVGPRRRRDHVEEQGHPPATTRSR